MSTQSGKSRSRLRSALAIAPGLGIWTARSARVEKTSAPMLEGSAAISAQSGSAQHSAGTSRALAQASTFLGSLTTCSAVTMSQQRVLDRYLAAIEKQGIHRIESDEATEFNPTEETWQLILLAVSRAKSIYSDSPYSSQDTTLGPSGYSKKMTISDNELPNQDHVIVVTIRGSVSFKDWLVNLNGAPVQAVMERESLEPPRACHGGFLAVAKDMQENVVRAIAEKLDGMAGTERAIDLLFTGHSAGGAIAKLFYAMSSSPGSLFSSVRPRFRDVHCIVFGAPPVATSPILQPQSPAFRSSLFLNMVNERDPIALAQQEYIHLLLECFVKAQGSNEASNAELQVPKPILRLSGTCVVLRDVCEKIEHTEWRAAVVKPEVLEGKLFGDVTMHHVDNYVKRIEAAHQASRFDVTKETITEGLAHGARARDSVTVLGTGAEHAICL